jgi:hypothetical protein
VFRKVDTFWTYQPLSAIQPLEESYLHCPTLALLGGAARHILSALAVLVSFSKMASDGNDN